LLINYKFVFNGYHIIRQYSMTKLIICNWKMNLGSQNSIEFLNQIEMAASNKDNKFIVCPPYTSLELVGNNIKEKQSDWALGAQNCSDQEDGARTGDISASMLETLGCQYVILGHSERRQYHLEDSKTVKMKALKALQHQLIPIVCVGETEEAYNQGKTQEVLKKQLEESVPSKQCVVAYEPVWAIGTGKVPQVEEIEETHHFIQSVLQEFGFSNVSIVYGGSVKANNITEILGQPSVSGVLIGGASIKPESMNPIVSKLSI